MFVQFAYIFCKGSVIQIQALAFSLKAVNLRCMGTHPSFPAMFSKGDKFSWLSVCLPGGQSLQKMESTLNK